MTRPAIPRPLRRAIEEEAGYRCGIPTCNESAAVDVAHITPWSEVREHRFENLILLCAVCHRRFDRGEIPRRAIEQYKENLLILNGRYGLYEMRLLRVLAAFHEVDEPSWIPAPMHSKLFFLQLLLDGLVEQPQPGGKGIYIGGAPVVDHYRLTEAGIAFIERWQRAEPLES